MNIFPLTAIGVSTLNSAGDMLDVRYHFIANKDKEFLNTINVENLGFENLKSMAEGSIDSREYVYHAEIEGKYNTAPVDAELKIKVGAQVMLVKNGENWVNGTLAIVDDLTKDSIHIKIKDEIYKLEKEKWEMGEEQFQGIIDEAREYITN